MNTSQEYAGMARRRSPRLHPQIQASEEGAGVTARRRSPRMHPQIQASEKGAGVTARRRSPRILPQIQAGEVGNRRIRRRRGTSPAGPSCMPDDDDMLREILVRLPPEPSSLPRASAVCKHWLGLVTDPKFHRQFYAHHRKPPLLGVFSWTYNQGNVFNPVLDPPNRIPLPPVRFSLPSYRSNHVLDSRHGLVLVRDCIWKKKVVVCDPITGEQHHVAIPPRFRRSFLEGAVLCAAGNQDHVHGGCHSSPFKVVLISTYRSELIARVYSSETGGWGNIMSTAAPYNDDIRGTSTLVGNSLYWLFSGNQILQLDLDGQGLSVIMGPPVVTNDFRRRRRQIVQAEDGAVGFAILSYPHFQMWVRNVNAHGLATWVPWKTIEMDSILGLPPRVEGEMGGKEKIKGYEEDSDVIFLKVNGSVYMVQLKLMQSKKISGNLKGRYHPFRSFYIPAIRGYDEANVLPDS